VHRPKAKRLHAVAKLIDQSFGMPERQHSNRPQPVFVAGDELLHPIVVGVRERGAEFALDIGRNTELGRKNSIW
jgi:hypothetical protein